MRRNPRPRRRLAAGRPPTPARPAPAVPVSPAALPIVVTRRAVWQAAVTLGPDDRLCVDGPTPTAAVQTLRAVRPVALAARALLTVTAAGDAPFPLAALGLSATLDA